MLCFAVLILIPAASAFARMEEPPRSFSLAGDEKRLEQVPVKRLPKVDTERLLAEDEERGKSLEFPGPQRFAVDVDVAFTLKNSGSWQTLPDGRLWRLRLQSPGAVSHNLGITHYQMPEGAKLWIYNPDHSHVEGPYTARDRSSLGSLWTPVIEGDEIVVEVFVPNGVDQPVLEIRRANQGYRGFEKGTPGACENDVICPVGAPWANQIRAVALLTVSGMYACSGTLLNDVPQNGIPYFLTAHHCNVTASSASSVVLYWNDNSPTCGTHGPPNMTDNQVGGATLRADYVPSDATLIQLASVPPAAYSVYYAGWDATGIAPPMTVGIHHPQAGVKSISFSNTPPVGALWPSGTVTPSGNHWRVAWDSGVTEDGSSGSCLFSTATQRCIGQLHGGPSKCGGTMQWDFYGKFSVSFYGGGTPATRLKDWLDPANTGTTALDGDPHVTTADQIHYDFQGAGEFVALRNVDGMEIQTRSLPISTAPPAADAYDGLQTCVSLNTAVATKVDGHRVTIEPNLSGVPDPSGLQVRVDGVLTALSTTGLAVGAGRALKTATGYEIGFPNGTALYVTPMFWTAQGKWYLNVDILRGPSLDGPGSTASPDLSGIMAPLAPGSWLPALPSGASVGALPATLHQRYLTLYSTFAPAWRVGTASLFDYASGTSTATFTVATWPPEAPPCNAPNSPTAPTLSSGTAAQICNSVTDHTLNANCIFDVAITGESGFANLFLISQQIRNGATLTLVNDAADPTAPGAAATFTAIVTPRTTQGVPAGTVQFLVDGRVMAGPITLDSTGQATWTTSSLTSGDHQVVVVYTAASGGVYLSSSSFEATHTVQ